MVETGNVVFLGPESTKFIYERANDASDLQNEVREAVKQLEACLKGYVQISTEQLLNIASDLYARLSDELAYRGSICQFDESIPVEQRCASCPIKVTEGCLGFNTVEQIKPTGGPLGIFRIFRPKLTSGIEMKTNTLNLVWVSLQDLDDFIKQMKKDPAHDGKQPQELAQDLYSVLDKLSMRIFGFYYHGLGYESLKYVAKELGL